MITPIKHPVNLIEKNQNGDFLFYGTTTPVNDAFVIFDIVVNFINFISSTLLWPPHKPRQKKTAKNEKLKIIDKNEKRYSMAKRNI